MTSGEKGENDTFWEQMEKFGAHQGGLEFPQLSQSSSKPSIFQNQLLSPCWGLILMTSGEKCENGGILGTNGEIGVQQGGLELTQVSQSSSQSSIFENQFLSTFWVDSNPHEKWGTR
jgi:hypothetical protein